MRQRAGKEARRRSVAVGLGGSRSTLRARAGSLRVGAQCAAACIQTPTYGPLKGSFKGDVGPTIHNFEAHHTAGSKNLEYGPGTIYAGVPFTLSFGVGGQAYSKFLASTVGSVGL